MTKIFWSPWFPALMVSELGPRGHEWEESDPMYQLCKHILFHSPRISKFWCESFGVKGIIRRIVVATRTRGIAREADVGLGNNSAILLRQKRTCTCILHTSVSPKENCPAIHLHMIISCLQLQYIVAIPQISLSWFLLPM